MKLVDYIVEFHEIQFLMDHLLKNIIKVYSRMP